MNADLLLAAYAKMTFIRQLEDRVAVLYRDGDVPGFVHTSVGQEAVAVGALLHARPDDVITSTHRGHGHVLAKGLEPRRMLAELMGRETGACHGRGGSMHLVDVAHGVLGATGVVAGNLALAAGAAWAAQAQGRQNIAVVFFGDGATGAGVFHETLNLAALWRLPVLFVCENNGYAEFTGREEHSNVKHVSSFAAPYAIPAKTIDGNDQLAVHESAYEAITMLRRGEGPYLLECMTFRLEGHSFGATTEYVDAEPPVVSKEDGIKSSRPQIQLQPQIGVKNATERDDAILGCGPQHAQPPGGDVDRIDPYNVVR